jgi:tetratricopeptide (TPR) repeat protein
MRERKPPAEALALRYLRAESGWSKEKLAAELGFSDARLILRYERGDKPLSREYLDHLVAPLGRPPEAVDALLFIHRLVAPEPAAEPVSPVALTSEEQTTIVRAAVTAGWTTVEEIQRVLTLRRRRQKKARARREATALLERLKLATWEEKRDLVRIFPAFRSWALAERVCQESVRAAAHRVSDALAWADLAVLIAEHSSEDERWKSRLLGFCWAHVANARRVATDFEGADEAFVRTWDFWRGGEGSDPQLLPEWRLFDLQASLRREQHRFQESLELLEQALERVREFSEAAGRILLNREFVLQQMGDLDAALATLKEAAPLIEKSPNPLLRFALRFNLADTLCRLERYTEAEPLLPEIREIAVQQAKELQLIRVLWLEAKIARGQGRTEAAISALQQVRRDFSAHQLSYETALASLDLALLWLKAGRSAEVKNLAREMAWIFASKRISREAMAALQVFCEAARQETATVELALTAIAEIEGAKRSTSRSQKSVRDRA